jgi:hypothetical protein
MPGRHHDHPGKVAGAIIKAAALKETLQTVVMRY